jgi:hypothetical protein
MLGEEKAQGAFEYVLLISGVMMIVATVVIVLRSAVVPEIGGQVADNAHELRNLLNCTSNGTCYG